MSHIYLFKHSLSSETSRSQNKCFKKSFLSFSTFCYIVTLALTINLILIEFNPKPSEERYTLDEISSLKLKYPKKITLGHPNINSICNKFDGIMSFVKGNLDIFLVSETKIDESFPKAQFLCEGYSPPYRRDRCLGGGGLLMYVNEDIPSRILTPHVIRDDIEILCVEINLRKQKWLIMGIYRPPGMNAVYFINNNCRGIDFYNNRYEHFVIMGCGNSE